MATVVHQLRIGTDLDDAHAVQSRVAAQLRAADLSPAGLPPGATLAVRRLGQGLPPWYVRPQDIWPPKDWQAAARERLDDLLRQAVWVRGGVIPESPQAILFPEDAELLAAQAVDWIEGALYSRWCWKTLYPREDPATAMVRSWIEKPECVPAAIERLAILRRAEQFLARLPDAVVESLLQTVVRVFALRYVEEVLARLAAGAPQAPNLVPPTVRAQQAAPIEFPGVGRIEDAAPVALRSLREVRRELLLEVAVKLRTAPAAARSAEFAARLQVRLLEAPTHKMDPRPSPPREEPVVYPRSEAAPAAPAAGPAPPDNVLEWIEPCALVPDPAEAETSAAPVAAPAAGRFDAVEIQTAFGGIFYLINLAIYLGYYGDFSTPDEPGIDLPLWDFLAQTGREMAGKPLLKDPVWRLLESLGEGEPWDGLEEAMGRIQEWLVVQVGEFTLEHAARVTLSDTRLDIFLLLDELPVEIRVARLDRDPGWVPAAGRFVAFHFL